MHARTTFALSDPRLPEPSAAISGISRSGRSFAPRAGELEAHFLSLSPSADIQESQTTGPQIPASQLPDQDAFGDVPGRPIRSHHARSVCSLSIDGESLEVALPKARFADAHLCRPGRIRFQHL